MNPKPKSLIIIGLLFIVMAAAIVFAFWISTSKDDTNFTSISGIACFERCMNSISILDQNNNMDVLIVKRGEHPLGVVRGYTSKDESSYFTLHEDGTYWFSCYGNELTPQCRAFLSNIMQSLVVE